MDKSGRDKLKIGNNKRKSDGWDEEGGYWKAKNDKLEKQTNITEVRKSDIFKNVAIWVNGYTDPTSDVLKELITQHGGRFIHYFSKTHVTHTIATNLPKSKVTNLKKNDKVVHSSWIVDSVTAGRLLAVDKYLLFSVNKRDGQTIEFKTSSNVSTIVSKTMDIKNNKSRLDTVKNSTTVDQTNQDSSRTDDVHGQNSAASLLKSPNKPQLSTHDYTASKDGVALKAGDTNFISEYYTHSRLHHLSLWKAELKRFSADIQKKRKTQAVRGPSKGVERVIMHVDMDSFFVSVAVKLNADLCGKPVAVCHSEGGANTSGSSWSSIASCSYVARQFGVKNGMMLGEAKQKCPELVCVPYQFAEYRKVSEMVYEVLSNYTLELEAVSCDEALLDVSNLITHDKSAVDVAEEIRVHIYTSTGCRASCGIGENILVARLATRRAKPDGVHHVLPHQLGQFIEEQKAEDLPGIGRSQAQKLTSLSVNTCADLQKISLPLLQKEFGPKTGETLYNFSRGLDTRPLKTVDDRKSVSAEINYGMRFTQIDEVKSFIFDLSKEVQSRLKEISKMGNQITLKIMIRAKDASVQPSKFMGHGKCDNASKSVTIASPTDDASVLAQHCVKLLQQLNVVAQDVRGIGIQIIIRVMMVYRLMMMTIITLMMTYGMMQKLSDVSACSTKANTLMQFVKPLNEIESRKKNEIDFQKIASLKDDLPALPFSRSSKNKEISFTSLKNSNIQGSSEKWEPSILNELPPEIRLELLNEAKHQTNNKTTQLPKQIANSKSTIQKSPSKDVVPKRKRGRPKKTEKRATEGKKSSKVDNQQACSSRATIFESMTRPKKSKLDVSISQLDSSFMAAMPDDIQDEILSNLRRNDKQPTNNKGEDLRNNKEPTTSSKDRSDSAVVVLENIDDRIPAQRIGPEFSKQYNLACVDQGVLKELPIDIQLEIINASRRLDKKKNETTGKKRADKVVFRYSSLTTDDKRNNGGSIGETDHPEDLSSPNKDEKRLKSTMDVQNAKTLLNSWFQSSSEPYEEDVREVSEYMVRLISSREMEKLQNLCKYLRRKLERMYLWHDAFNTILSQVQTSMYKSYQGHLLIVPL